MPISEIMNMPYSFLIDIMAEKAKPKHEESLIGAFGGSSPRNT